MADDLDNLSIQSGVPMGPPLPQQPVSAEDFARLKAAQLSGEPGQRSVAEQAQSTVPAPTTLTPPLSQPSAIQGSMNAGQVTNFTDQQLPPRPVGTSVASKPISKAEFFRDMLGKFMYSVGEGLAGRGTGPMADSRGAGIAMGALHGLDVQQQQLEIARKNAEALQAYHGAQAGALQNRFGLVSVPMFDNEGKPIIGSDGNVVTRVMPSDQAERYLQGLGQAGIRAGAVTGAATIKANAGQVAITADIAKKLGLSDDTVGKNLTAQQIRALTPKNSPNKIAATTEGIYMVDNNGKPIARIGGNPSVANAQAANQNRITVEDMRENNALTIRTMNNADAATRAQYTKDRTGIEKWADDQRKTGYPDFTPPPTGNAAADAREAEQLFNAEYTRRVDNANQKLLDGTAANKPATPAQGPKGPANQPKPNQLAANPMANVVQQDPVLQKVVTALSGIKDKGKLKTQIEGSTTLGPGQKTILKKYYGIS